MNPIKLTSDDGKRTAWACGICMSIRPQDYVAKCCTCSECGGELDPKDDYSTIHRNCNDQRHQSIMDRKLAEAEEVPYEGGFVFVDGLGYRDGYFYDMESLLDFLADEPPDVCPAWAFACECRESRLDLGEMIEHLCDDGYKEMSEHLEIPQSLVTAIDEFNDANKVALQSWEWTSKRKYRVSVAEDRQEPTE